MCVGSVMQSRYQDPYQDVFCGHVICAAFQGWAVRKKAWYALPLQMFESHINGGFLFGLLDGSRCVCQAHSCRCPRHAAVAGYKVQPPVSESIWCMVLCNWQVNHTASQEMQAGDACGAVKSL